MCRFLFVAGALSIFVSGCRSHDDFGPPPQTVVQDSPPARPIDAHPDAFVPRDAHEYHDAHVYQDAKVYEDAPPVRACTNADNFIAPNGTETLTLAFTCSYTSDAGNVLAKLSGSYGTATETVAQSFNLDCGTVGQPRNEILMFPAGMTTAAGSGTGSGTSTIYYPLTVETVTGGSFVVACN